MASSDSMVDGPPTKKAKIGGDTSGKCNIYLSFSLAQKSLKTYISYKIERALVLVSLKYKTQFLPSQSFSKQISLSNWNKILKNCNI